MFAFEPHPEIYKELVFNVNLLPEETQVFPQNMALSNRVGEGFLSVPEEFDENRGVSLLTSDNLNIENKNNYKIELTTLDQFWENSEKIALIKIDVEGHELEVLKGAAKLLDKKLIRDIIFEDHVKDPYPTPVTKFLEERGYTLFYLCKNLFGSEIGDLKNGKNKYKSYDYYSCLATNEPERLLTRLKNKPWAVLNSQP